MIKWVSSNSLDYPLHVCQSKRIIEITIQCKIVNVKFTLSLYSTCIVYIPMICFTIASNDISYSLK